MSKAADKEEFRKLLLMAPVMDELKGEYLETALGLTRHMAVVYSEMANPRFIVTIGSTPYSRKQVRTLNIWKSDKQRWVPLPASRVFANTKNKPSTKKQKVLSALRECIKPQVDECRMLTEVPFICALTGELKESKEGCHVDHFTYPFIQIVEMWLNLRQLNYELLALDRAGRIKSSELAADFYRFHKEYAVLKLVDGPANMAKGAKWIRH